MLSSIVRKTAAAGCGVVGRGCGNSSRRAVAASLQRRSMGSDGHMPVPQSMQAKLWQGHPTSEGWESTMAWWYGTSFALLVAVLGFAPETEIAVWARQEASARLHLKETGAVESLEFGKHYQDVVESQVESNWDKFTLKSLKMNDDDDDDEDDEEDDDEDDDDDE